MSVKVLLVQGSAYQRILFSNMLSSHKNINTVSVERNVKGAFERIIRDKPDVWIIDIGLTELNDLKIIQTLIKKFSIPTIFLIPANLKTEEPSFKALSSIAFDFIIKPSGIWKEEIPKIKNELISKTLLASKSNRGKTTDTVNIVMKNTIKTDITVGTGGTFFLNNTTFKGPIEFLSEQKPIKTSTECSEYTTLLRWKNDLGGWDIWNFKRFRTFKEEVSNKVEIRRDVTQDWDNYFINGDTEYDTIHQDIRKVITLRSELLTENEQEILNQIRRSIKVQIQLDSGKWVTVTITGGSYELFDEDTKIREVSFDVKLPNTLVQEQ